MWNFLFAPLAALACLTPVASDAILASLTEMTTLGQTWLAGTELRSTWVQFNGAELNGIRVPSTGKGLHGFVLSLSISIFYSFG